MCFIICAKPNTSFIIIQQQDKALRLKPNDKDTLLNKAGALYSMGNISWARPYYNKSLSLTPKELLIYEKSTYAIRVQYPCDWSVAGTNGSTLTFVRFFSPAFNVATVTFGTETLPINITTLGNYTHLIIDYEKTFPAFKMLGLKTNSTLAGKSAYTLIGTYQDPSSGLQKLMEVRTIIGDKAYYIQYKTRYSDYLPTLQKIIDSLTVKSWHTQR